MNVAERLVGWWAMRKLAPARGIFTHLTESEKVMLYRLAKGCRARIYIEIGSYLGASSCCIAQGVLDSRSRGRLFCVDTWCNDGMTEGTRDTFDAFTANTRCYREVIAVRRGLSREVARSFDLEAGFVFFDGDHSLDGVTDDWESWEPHLAGDALVVFHDYEWAAGVRKVVHEKVLPRARHHGHLPNLWWGRIR